MVQCIGLQKRFNIYMSDYSTSINFSNTFSCFNSSTTFSQNFDSFTENNSIQSFSNRPKRKLCQTPEISHKRYISQNNSDLFLQQNKNQLIESLIRHNNLKFHRKKSLNQVNSQTSTDFTEFFKISKLDNRCFHFLSSTKQKKGNRNLSRLFPPEEFRGNPQRKKYLKDSLNSRNIKGNKNKIKNKNNSKNKNYSFNCLGIFNRNRNSNLFLTGKQFRSKSYLHKFDNIDTKIQKRLKESLLKMNSHNGLKTNYIPYKDLIQFQEKTKRKIDITKMLICKNAIFNYRGIRKGSKESNFTNLNSRKSNDNFSNLKNKTLNVIHCLIPTVVEHLQD